MNIGLAGYGNWGEKLARAFVGTHGARLTAIADCSPVRLHEAARHYPESPRFACLEQLLHDDDIEAVIVTTPLSTHYELGRAVLERGRHLLIEKPMAATEAEAAELAELAYSKSLCLTVDHTFVYSGAVGALRSLVEDGELGQVLCVDSSRVNFGLFRPDANVVWDLAVHDFSILEHVFGPRSASVTASAVGLPRLGGEFDAHLGIQFGDGSRAQLHVSWLAPEKVRRMTLCGDRALALYDDLDPVKVRVYARSVEDKGKGVVAYRDDGIRIPVVDDAEPLRKLAAAFVDAARSGKPTPSDAKAGLRAIRFLVAADCSIRMRGRPVEL